MKIVIDIPRSEYNSIVWTVKNGLLNSHQYFERLIANGTTLQQGKWVQDCAFVDELTGQLYLVDRCNQCGYVGNIDMKFCPDCGAEMEERTEDES